MIYPNFILILLYYIYYIIHFELFFIPCYFYSQCKSIIDIEINLLEGKNQVSKIPS